MFSFWNRGPTKDFPYEIGDTLAGHDDISIWVLHKGKKRATGEPVSIFRHELKPGREDAFEKAKVGLKRLKTLRHPNFLTFIDSLETDRFVCIVTEHIEPLDQYLSSISDYTSEQRRLAISWGLYQVSKGLGFLINDCNLNHNNIFSGSIFVNDAGSWKIGDLEYVTSSTVDSVPIKPVPGLDKYQTPESSKATKWCTDSWGLGCLIWESFNGWLTSTQALKSPGKIPKSLVPVFNELISPNAGRRPSPLDFIERCRSPNGFFKNNFIDAMLFLDEFQIKEATEKNRFFSQLDSQLEKFPSDICRNKILPQLINAFEYGNAGSAILGSLFKIGKSLDDEQYKQKIVPCIVKLFASKDRATRAKLLQQMEFFIKHLSKNIVNDQIYPQVAQGFVDSNPTIREQTVKCMLHLAPKLNYNNLNEDVLKHFARLQARDEEGGIRTNTTVCLGKIACHLNPQTRQTVLIPAFLRSMRDPFPPARIAGILALSATQNFYSLKDTATKVMSALCHLTTDPEKSVREQAFKALKGFISKVEKVSEDPSLAAQMEADLNAAGSEASSTLAAASWAGWAVSSLTSKFYRSKTPTASTDSTAPKAAATEAAAEKQRQYSGSGNDKRESTSTLSKSLSHSEESVDDDSLVWGTIEDEQQPTGHNGHDNNRQISAAAGSEWNSAAEREGDGWDSFDCDAPELDAGGGGGTSAAAKAEPALRKTGSNDDSLFDSFLGDSKPTVGGRTVVKHRVSSSEQKITVDHGPPAPGTTGQKPRAARKGPMKLGAQKIT